MAESFNIALISMSLWFLLLNISEAFLNYQIHFSLFGFSLQFIGKVKLKYGFCKTYIALCLSSLHFNILMPFAFFTFDIQFVIRKK